VSAKDKPAGLTGEARDRVAAELARLQERRDRLKAEVRNDRGAVGDDGDVVKMQVISVIEEASIDGEAEALTASSPLGRALVGRKAGDKISYTTPQGEQQVELLDVQYPA
jgi:transcription elongation factor GreA